MLPALPACMPALPCPPACSCPPCLLLPCLPLPLPLLFCLQAPTEILADQHHRNLQALVQSINRLAGQQGLLGFRQPRIALVRGPPGSLQLAYASSLRAPCISLLFAQFVPALACRSAASPCPRTCS